MKKITAMLLALVLAFGLLSGCSDGDSAASSAPEPAKQETASASEQAPAVSEEAVQEASSEPEASSSEETVEEEVYELPLTTDGETLTMFAITNSNVTDNIGELGNHQIYLEAEKITGVKVNIQAVMQEVANDQFSLVIASGDWPDMVRSANYPAGLTSAFEEEIVVDMANYLEYAPNYAKILNENPDIAKDAKTDDGNILEMYYLNSYNGTFEVPLLEGPVIRGDLLDAAGLEVPTTVDALYDVLTKFKTEYGLADPLFMSNNAFAAGGFLMGAFDATAELYQVDGTVKYGPMEAGFKTYLETITKWYSEGLLNADFYNYDENPMSPVTEGKKTGGDVGVFNAPASNLKAYCSDTVTYVGMPILPNEEGENHFITTITLDTSKGMTITTTCSNIELAMAWCDFWYSEPGRLLSNYGIEGVTFEYDDNGVPRWTDMLLNNSDGLSVGIARQCYVTLTQQPGVCPKEIEVSLLDDNALAAVEIWSQVGDADYDMPNVSLTSAESSRASQIYSDLDTLSQETWYKILLGQADISIWDEYLSQMETMGVQEYIDIYQTALDRYNAR